MDLERKIRKNRNFMVTAGTAIQIFTFWAFFKSVLYVILNQDTIKALVEAQTTDRFILILAEIIALIVIALISLIFVYAGRCSIREGKQGKWHPSTFFWITVVLIYTAACIPFDLTLQGGFSAPEAMATLLTDLVSLILCIQIIVSAVFLRRHVPEGRG